MSTPPNDRRAIEAALAAMDRVSDEDPSRVEHEGRSIGAALLYAMRMSACLASLEPQAGDALTLAVRAQHLGRFRLPRSAYPEGRVGYLSWRAEQARRHAALATEIITGAGLPSALAERVASIVQKKKRHEDPEAQTLEDCACLVFLEHEIDAFAWPTNGPHRDEAELVPIVQKTWKKMSARAQARALALPLSPRAAALVARALA
jgi:hypothetical protein